MFSYGQKAYSLEIKLACIEMKKTGKSHKVIMDTLGIKNVSQIKTCGDGIEMMNSTDSTNLLESSIRTVKAWLNYLSLSN